MPIEPPASQWQFRSPLRSGADDVVAIGGDLEPGTLLAAYRAGVFPMPVDGAPAMVWWSPDPRGVLPLEALRVSSSLRRSCGRYEIRVDSAFAAVVDACADPGRPHGWIDRAIREAYVELHRLGWAHSVEAWTPDGELAGGLYGVAVGGLFAGESMFHRRTDASKVALVALVSMMRSDGVSGRLLDVQWRTDHLARLGAVELARPRYLQCLERALERPLPRALAAGSDTPDSG